MLKGRASRVEEGPAQPRSPGPAQSCKIKDEKAGREEVQAGQEEGQGNRRAPWGGCSNKGESLRQKHTLARGAKGPGKPLHWKGDNGGLVALACLIHVTPRTVPARLLCPWDFPSKNTGVGCHFPLQGIFPTQRLNPGLLHCRQILYQLSYQEARHWEGEGLQIRSRQLEIVERQWTALATFTRQSGWLLSKSLQAINAGEGVEKREPSYTVGGNAS